jgi:predicted nucleic acid-binding Zn ribbon protein
MFTRFMYPSLSWRSPPTYNTTMNPTRGRRPERIGDLVRERIAALGWEPRLREEEVITCWDAAVGPQIAAHARPSHIAGRRLTIVTESPVWTQQLSMLKPELLRRIAGSFGPDTVTDLFFVTGKIEPAPRDPAPAELPPVLESELGGIADAEVRESVRRLMLAALADGDPPTPGANPG